MTDPYAMNQRYRTERPNITRAIVRLNNNFGWGDVKAVRRFLDGRIEVDISSRYRRQKTYIARVVGRNSVRFRGHQMSYLEGVTP
jgi:hypothetical protein